jgi:predicted nucleotide-binding protein (sugar kinase/HSP70/actin superfamily)
MAQAQRLDLPMGDCFSDAAFSSLKPADLGNRCTVFMESDLIHHQNSGASSADLAAGVCISIVHNYLERVANHKPLGSKVLFMGGVAATPAVKAAFEQQTLRKFETPPFFRVSGAVGAALKALERLERKEMVPRDRTVIRWNHEEISKEQFTCKGCTNECGISKYKTSDRTIFHGGLCDRWEAERTSPRPSSETDLFSLRARLLNELSENAGGNDQVWAMVQSPQFCEWFPFWKAFCEDLGISLLVAPPPNRKQFESGSRFLRVETCLPMKVMAGQIEHLVNRGVKTIFHPAILSERPPVQDDRPLDHCPYIQASSQFFRGAFDLEWKEPVVNCEIDPDAFQREHVSFARSLGVSHHRAMSAFNNALEHLEEFQARLRREGEHFVNSLGRSEPAIVVLGKPYHTSDPFLNMNLGSLFHRLGIRAIPGDLYPLSTKRADRPVSWKYQGNLIEVARAIAKDPRVFPVLTTFFGCGPDPFTLRHIRENLADKPLLVLEMDEHSSRAGIITRLEAFLDRISLDRTPRKVRAYPRPVSKRYGVLEEGKPAEPQAAAAKLVEPLSPEVEEDSDPSAGDSTILAPSGKAKPRVPKPEVLYVPFMGDHAYGFAAAARSVGIDARVLPPPDEESERLGRPHTVGGECHPYALVLGDYLKIAQALPAGAARRSLFYMIGPDVCRLGQFPTYIEKVRRELDFNIGVIRDVDEGIAAFGVSPRCRQQVLLRAWEGLNAYDVLLRLFLQIRPMTHDQELLERVYVGCRDKLYKALSEGKVRAGMDEVLHDLYAVPLEDSAPRPVVAVTGDYYTRIVPYANNDVYMEIEALGGTLWSSPTFSDSFKLGTLRDFVWSVLSGRSRSAAEHGIFYTLMTISEYKIKGLPGVRKVLNQSTDLLGLDMWKKATRHAHSRLPAGITAPLATTLNYLDQGADGVLNLMTLNCMYGTVVTAALLRALKKRPRTPLLTLVFDGLKKTNEKTRLEAFMEQVHDRFQNELHSCGRRSVG